ncbi:hypothetical protein N9L26_02780 [Candidatus Pacebacteria bacterium]|nr:hypothetical protein [Candidatus Paceibacterota bacterium]
MNKKFLLLIVALGIVVLIGFMFFDGDGIKYDREGSSEPSIDALDTVFDFYNPWLRAVQATDTDPYAEGLIESAQLSETLKTSLREAGEGNPETDPVLCQRTIPDRIGAKVLLEVDDKAQIRVIARGTKLPGQAVAYMVIEDGEWVIDRIQCTYGESGPEVGEFNFIQSGQLLKSVPEPLDSNFWHLVYANDEYEGLTAKLLFNAESICVATDGSEAACVPDELAETAPAIVKGNALEEGIVVSRLELQ